MENKIAFCNVSFGDRYVQTQQRLKDSILAIYPDAHLFFWTDELPPGSKPFQKSLYGFKVHAIKHARSLGFDKIVWVDTCAILKSEVQPLFDAEFLAVKDENMLYRYCSNRLKYLVSKDWNLVGGSLYLFDFENKFYSSVFESWEAMEWQGLFGSQYQISHEENDGIEKCGHRMDETCMAICIYKASRQPHSRDIYDTVIEKKHFLENQTGLQNYLKND